jgi:hypothetical protein
VLDVKLDTLSIFFSFQETITLKTFFRSFTFT